MAVSINYRGNGPWGVGLGRNLTPNEVDQNFFALADAIVALQGDMPTPDNIASISVEGTVMTIHLQSGTSIGPIPMPFLRFGWQGFWSAGKVYNPTDVFVVDGQGVYFVNLPYTAGSTFDEAVADVDGNPLLIKLFGFSGTTDSTYDLGFYYAGRLADQTSGYLYQERLLRKIMIAATDFHNAYLQETAAGSLSLPILYNDNPIGSITFGAGAHEGAFVWTAGDVTIDYRERLAVGLPGSGDLTAAGLSVGFGAVRA